jgi:hypothetical protein
MNCGRHKSELIDASIRFIRVCDKNDTHGNRKPSLYAIELAEGSGRAA